MTIYFRPVGRGNWHESRMKVSLVHMPPLAVRVGDRFTLGDVEFRVTRIGA